MSEHGPTRREAKKAESDAYLARVQAALEEAHGAAAAAFAEFMRSAKLTPDGFVADVCGNALVVAFKPNYRLRTTLKAMGEIEKGYRGAWHISNFEKHVRGQSMAAHEAACQAACSVLRERLAGEGEFFATSYMT